MRRLFWAAGVCLLPWIAVLGTTLPDVVQAQHWRLAWTGIDAVEAAGLLVTAWLLGRDDPRTPLVATATATLLLADAWFDVTTAGPGLDHSLALVQGLVLEVPLAILAFALASRTLRASGRSAPAPVGG